MSFKQHILVFLICFGAVLGNNYLTYLHFDYSGIPDAASYLKMGEGNFDVTATHRYRVVVPALAAATAIPINKVYEKLWPNRSESQWPLKFSFYLINSFLFSLAAYLIFLTCLAYKASVISSLIALIAVISSRWVQVMAAIPMTDSFYLLVIALSVYGMKKQSPALLATAIVLGPLAKESFIFIAPIILFYGRNTIPFIKQAPLFVLGGILAFGTRHLIDLHLTIAATESLNNAFAHFENFKHTFFRLFSIRGAGEILSVYSIFSLIIFIGLTGGKNERNKWIKYLDGPCLFLPIVIILHMFLSTEAGRMMFFASPVVAVVMALILDKHKAFTPWQKLQNTLNGANIHLKNNDPKPVAKL
ncbi:hypothetical protein RCC89_15615 [Cytophagaceae bacterium ABcell3]|nr:hypothetical protein RCC89_15615 [Cytophagaceae bacterium ABcell3]